jgi:hypothetical protein
MIRVEERPQATLPSKVVHAPDSLPALLDRAASALAAAKDSAEVLEARDMARVAYDAAKSAGRLARAKQAHDTVLSQVYRAQADALMIEARAKMRLAEEYDAAKEAGEVAGHGGNRGNQHVAKVAGPDLATIADIGLSKQEISDARQIRDAEKAEPGIAQRALNAMLDRGEEPTKAKLNREIVNRPKPEKVMNPTALWLWGRLKDFERDGVLTQDPKFLINEMTEPMRDDVRRLSPLVGAFLAKLEIE